MERTTDFPARALVAIIAALAIGLGAFVVAVRDVPQTRTLGTPVLQPVTLDDLLLAAASSPGITLNFQGNKMPVQSFQFGIGRAITPPTGPGHEAGTPSVSEIVVTKLMDKYSMDLLQASLNGQDSQVKFTFTNNSGAGSTPYDYMTLVLDGTLVSGYNLAASADDQPTESISFNFTVMTFTYRERGMPAAKVASWNLATQTPT